MSREEIAGTGGMARIRKGCLLLAELFKAQDLSARRAGAPGTTRRQRDRTMSRPTVSSHGAGQEEHPDPGAFDCVKWTRETRNRLHVGRWRP